MDCSNKGVPEPLYKLNGLYAEKNHSVDDEVIVIFDLDYTDIPTSCGHPYPFELFIKQAGFECQNSGTVLSVIVAAATIILLVKLPINRPRLLFFCGYYYG